MSLWPYPRVFVHRGGGLLAPENTLAAFDVARRFACGIEIDVMLSADGTPHLFHDTTLDRTTDGAGRFAATGDAALAVLDAGVRFAASFAGARIPTLAAAARRAQQLGLATNLEIKPAPGAEDESGAVIAAHAARLWRDAKRPPLLSSFSQAALLAARRAAPQLPRALLVQAVPEDWYARCLHVGASALHFDTAFARRARIEAIRSAGIAVVLYTENDPRRATRRFAAGVDAIVTDRPDRVRAPASRP